MTEVEVMMKELGLMGAIWDVVVRDDELPGEATRRMAIVRVHMEKPYSQYWFFRTCRLLGFSNGSQISAYQ